MITFLYDRELFKIVKVLGLRKISIIAVSVHFFCAEIVHSDMKFGIQIDHNYI